MEIGESKIVNQIVKVLMLIAFLGILALHLCSCAGPKTFVSSSEPQIFTDDYILCK